MPEPPPVKELAAFSGMLCLFLFGVSYLGAKSLRARGLERRAGPWVFELWLVAVVAVGLFVLSGRLVGWNFVAALGALGELRGGATTFALAVVGALMGLGCVFRMLALVREGIGTFTMDDSGGEGEESDDDE